MLFLTKIWIAVHPIDRPRSSALHGPPEIDMCAPSKGVYRSLVAGLGRFALPVFRGILLRSSGSTAAPAKSIARPGLGAYQIREHVSCRRRHSRRNRRVLRETTGSR